MTNVCFSTSIVSTVLEAPERNKNQQFHIKLPFTIMCSRPESVSYCAIVPLLYLYIILLILFRP